MIRALAFVTMFGLVVLAASPAAPQIGAPAAPVEPVSDTNVAAEEDLIGRMTTEVFINGQGPFNFVIDTGANRSALSRALATRLLLPEAPPGTVHAFTGAFTAPMVRVDRLTSGAATLTDVILPLIDTVVLASADGILGAEALVDRRLIFDFRRDRVVIERPTQRLLGPRWMEVRAERRFGNLFVAEGRAGRVPIQMIIDTGANHSIANTALQRALRGRLMAPSRSSTGTRITSASGPRPIVVNDAIHIPRIDFNTMEVSGIVAYVADLYIFHLWGLMDTPTLVVGMDILSSVDAFAIDYSRGLIHFRGGSHGRPFMERP